MNAQQNAFLKMAVPGAQAAQKKWGVPASVTIAQAILESGWGASSLAKQANNFFGIKAVASAEGRVPMKNHIRASLGRFCRNYLSYL